MKLIGIPLRRPAFGEFTASTVMGVGLWVAALGLMRAGEIPIDRPDAGALLVVMLWGCLCARFGIRVDQGRRHLMANLMITGLLLGAYHTACTLAG